MAIDRWDPAKDGGSFTAYAVPTMLGEVRRFVCDTHGRCVLARAAVAFDTK